MITYVFSTIWRYFRLYGRFLEFSFGKGFEFRFDFYMRIIMDLCYYAVAIAFFKVLYLHTSTLGGWSENQIMIFVSGYLIVDAINMTLFSNNMWILPRLINRGDLDYYLVRPVSSLFFVSFRDFAVNSFVNLVFALGIFGWALAKYEGNVGVGQVLLYLLLLLQGTSIFYSLNIMTSIVVFWTHDARGFHEIVWSLNKFAERPDGIYSGFTRKVLTLMLPFSVINSFPARIFLDGFSWSTFLHIQAVSFIFIGIVIFVWSRGLRSYSSASS